MTVYLLLGLSSAVLVLLVTPLVSRGSIRLGLVDAPGGRKVHPQSVPRLGGVAVVTAMVLAMILVRLWAPRDFGPAIWPAFSLERMKSNVTLVNSNWAGEHVRRFLFRSLQAQARALGNWIQFRSDDSREDLRGLMGAHRYGIHGMREEHFGMAPAELARAGVIVWVPRGGGQNQRGVS